MHFDDRGADSYEQLPMFEESPPVPRQLRVLQLVDAVVLPAEYIDYINWPVVNQWPSFQQNDREILELVVRGASIGEMHTKLPRRSKDNIKRARQHLLDISGAETIQQLITMALSPDPERSAERSGVRSVKHG